MKVLGELEILNSFESISLNKNLLICNGDDDFAISFYAFCTI